MRAVVYHGARDLRVEEMPDPEPGPGELLLQVHAAGVCGTDAAEWQHGPSIYAFPGPHPITGHRGPLIPGHELSGRVVARGSGVLGFDDGTLVACGAGYVTDPNEDLARVKPNMAKSYATVGLQRNGGLAHYVAVPAECCLDVGPFGLNGDAAALAQPMAIAVHSFHRGRPELGESALVIGAGGIGAFLIHAAVAFGLRVAVADLSTDRLEIAASLGADVLLGPDEIANMEAQLAEHGFVAPLIYEVTGSEEGLRASLRIGEAMGARIVVVGLHDEPRAIDLRRVTLREIELLGTNAHVCGTDLPQAVRLLARRGDWSDVAPQAFPLDDALDEGIVPMAERRSTRVKTLIDPWVSEPRATLTQ